MKLFIFLVCVLGSSLASRAQATSEGPHYFAQCMLDIPDETEFSNLENALRANPYVQVVRLDKVTRRAFLLTKDLPSFSQEQFSAWLGEYAQDASCIQVGLHGVDQVNPYPFTECND